MPTTELPKKQIPATEDEREYRDTVDKATRVVIRTYRKALERLEKA
jgi:hypothetical protein